ncbi:hypothetical protein GGI07_001057 [Coemansia sp. Benny D115]|nr:hypothetical protein GGI07_001057 [Coemansia sp. Benny D115]
MKMEPTLSVYIYAFANNVREDLDYDFDFIPSIGELKQIIKERNKEYTRFRIYALSPCDAFYEEHKQELQMFETWIYNKTVPIDD